jgi:hypothetical protein
MKILLTLLLIALALPGAASAVIIDDFTVGPYQLGREGYALPYTVTDTQLDASGVHILGGAREVTLEKITGSATQPYTALITTFGATYNSSFNCTAFWTHTYGADTDLNVDLTAGGATALVIDVIAGDMAASVPPRPTPFTVTLASGTGTASTTIQLLDNQIYFLPFTDFAGVDLTDVDRISFTVEQNPAFNDAIDFGIDFFSTDIHLGVATEESSWSDVKALFR